MQKLMFNISICEITDAGSQGLPATVMDSLVIGSEGNLLKVLHGNEFIPLQAGDQLRVKDKLISVTEFFLDDEKQARPVASAQLVVPQDKGPMEPYIQHAEPHFPTPHWNGADAWLELDTLVIGQLTNSRLDFLFRKGAVSGIKNTLAEGDKHYTHSYQPLPFLKQHFQPPAAITLAESNSHLESALDFSQQEKDPEEANILRDLGIFSGHERKFIF